MDVVLNGQQHGSDLVGCEAASVATLCAIQQLHPDIVINSGTCGAFKKNGAAIGEVYVANAVMFHDRRVPGDDAWGTQALGNYPVYAGAAELANSLGYKMGKVTTGSSLDMQPCDLQIIEENHGELKDMEGAAVAFVCSLFQTPILLLKSVTDLCDSGAETFEELNARTASFLDELVYPKLEEGKDILIVGHGAMNCSLISNIKHLPREEFWSYGLDQCKLMQLI